MGRTRKSKRAAAFEINPVDGALWDELVELFDRCPATERKPSADR